MKAVTANVVTSIQVIGHGIKVSVLRDRMMESGVKYGDLGQFRTEDFLHATIPLMLLGLWRGAKSMQSSIPLAPRR